MAELSAVETLQRAADLAGECAGAMAAALEAHMRAMLELHRSDGRFCFNDGYLWNDGCPSLRSVADLARQIIQDLGEPE